ncbi:antitoxin [Argonema galeatum]|uniref:antitoxin n=1 Tax=Argonema galeatum TaxID=2942762 RepID=UPI002012E635|nr:antitoxin [Argonema galeatum]MCL1465720.1 antitoxin [Argonema galeatum A003/A1]
MKVKNIGDKTMEPEYDLSKMKKRPNPFAKQLKKQVTISLGIDVIEYFENMAQESGISSQELINLYLQYCVVSQRKLSISN